MSSEDVVEAINKYIDEQARDILESTEQALDDYAESAKKRLRAIVKSVRKQGETLDILLPMNLLAVITEGGFVKSVEKNYDRDVNWRFEVGMEDVFYEEYAHNRLKPGNYRFTLIVEKLGKLEDLTLTA